MGVCDSLSTKADPRARNAALATAAHQHNAALRAIDNPRELARAARIVRAAIEHGYLAKSDLDGPIVQVPS